MNNSSPPSNMDILQQRDNYHFVPPSQMSANHYHNNTTAEQQLHWKLQNQHHEPAHTLQSAYIPSNMVNMGNGNPRMMTEIPSHNPQQQQQHQHHHQHQHQHQQPVLQMELPRSVPSSRPQPSMQPLQLIRWAQRPKFATSFWEEEGTLCYQVDANSVCVARRQDNDMINGTKLLNVTGMSRGKRDGILKNEKARVVVKVGPMHLKGVWITFNRAKELSQQFKISELLHPLFLDDPSVYFQNMQNHALPVQFVPPNQTEIPKEQTHEFERYEYSDVSAGQTNAFSQSTPSMEMHEPFTLPSQINQSAPPTATTTTSMSSYFASPDSRKPSPVTHHVYPSYNDSSNSSSSNNNAVNHFLTQENCLMGFPGSPMSMVPLATPGPSVPVIHAQENYDFHTAASQFQRFNADEMLLSQQQQQQQQQQPQPPPPPQYHRQQQFIPYATNPSNFLCSPPMSANNSNPPTPTDPSATFQFELNSHRQRTMSHNQPPSNTFASNAYQQQQNGGFNLYDF